MKQNKNFGKINDNGSIQYAPLPLLINGNTWTNDVKLHESFGYYPVIKTRKPEREGYYYTSYYVFENNTCIEKWKENKFNNAKVESINEEGNANE